MINREAILYEDYQKKMNDKAENVTVLHIGTVVNDDGSYIAASVEKKMDQLLRSITIDYNLSNINQEKLKDNKSLNLT